MTLESTEKKTILSAETRDAIVQLAGRLIEENGIAQTEAIYRTNEALNRLDAVLQTGRELAEGIREILASEEKSAPTPVETREAIQAGKDWYPYGMSKLRFIPETSFAKTLDLVEGIRMMMERNATLIAGNFPTNVRYNLSKRNRRVQNPKTAEEIDEEARENARLMGIIDTLLFEAIQDYLVILEINELLGDKIKADLGPSVVWEAFELPHYYPIVHLHVMAKHTLLEEPPGNPKKVPIAPISEIVDEDFEELHSQIKELKAQDAQFRDMVYECVPRSELKKKQRDLPYDELNERSQGIIDELSEYAELEIAMILYFNKGLKLGHSGETPYNEAAKYAAEKLDLEEPQFLEIAPEGLEKNNLLYREYRPGTAEKDKRSLTMATSWIDKESAERVGQTFQIHRLLLEKISKTPLIESEEERELLRELAIMHVTQEMVVSLSDQCPEFADAFEKAKVQAVIEEKASISELEEPNGDIAFECIRREGESDPAYFVRFVAEMVQGQMKTAEITKLRKGDLTMEAYYKKMNRLYLAERRMSRIWSHARHQGMLDPEDKGKELDLEDAWQESKRLWKMTIVQIDFK